MRIFSLILLSTVTLAQVATAVPLPEYKKATEDDDNVKNKKFTKKGRLEVSIPNAGMIINQSFINTYLIHGSLTYFTSEEWGYSLEADYGINEDQHERHCLETFYNDADGNVDEECAAEGDSGPKSGEKAANFGPAYMPIREINYIVSGNIVWNPIYGKQILLLSATSYFDVFLTAGGGAVMSTYYPKSLELKNGRKSRGVKNSKTGELDGGADRKEHDQYGKEGRPDAEEQTNAFINLGLGQKYHFWNRYTIRFEFRNMTLLGTPNGFENLFAIETGLGFRF